MGSHFRVVLADLKEAGDTFTQGSAAFAVLHPRLAPASAASGDATLDAALDALLGVFSVAGEALVMVMHNHGEKLTRCHDNYREYDSDVAALYDRLIEEAAA